MQDLVAIRTARAFTETFYRRLVTHGQVDLAANEARSGLLTAGLPGAAIPALFMRLPEGRLAAAAQDVAATAQEAVAQPVSAGGAAKPKGTKTVVISYNHKDEAWKTRLATQLEVLGKLGLLDPWDDRRIRAGDDWRPAIQAAMDRAAVAVLLISADYLTSDFVLQEEIPRLLQRRTQEGLQVIPLIVRPCPWKLVPWLKGITPRPADGRALAAGTEYQVDAELEALAYEIAEIVGVPGGAAG
jgi:hypothetical protein